MTIPNFGCLMDNEASCLPYTPEEERRIVEELTKEAESNLKEGSLYYVISNRWFVHWQRYTGQDTGDSPIDEHPTGSQHSNGYLSKKAERPEQIDNGHLIKSGSDGEVDDLELIRPLEEGCDYVLVAQEVWKKLQEWYKGGPALPRRLISHGDVHKNFTVEVYPLCLNLIDSRDNSQSVIRISKMASGRELYDRVCSLLKLEPEKIHIWDYFNKRKHSLLAISTRTLEEMNLLMDQHGELAVGFGDLLRKIWSSGRTAIAPRAFKGKLARFAPQFSGYNQHDSQELLAFLLDGLHEDLNRVKHKPYIETKDANGRPNEEVANECWEYHKARNDSVIVDVCQGQYKSTLVCPVCSKVSVTFDPFMYLSLPLPSTVTRTMTIAVFFGDGSALPMPYTVSVLKHGCCKDLIQALSNACCLKSDESILLAEVYDHRIYRYLEKPCDPLAMIKDDEYIVAYRLPINHTELTRLEIVHRSKGKATLDMNSSSDWKLFGAPLVTCLGEGPQTETDVQIAIHKVLAPLQRKSYFSFTRTLANEENGTASGVDIDRSNSCNPQSSLWGQSSDNMEVEQTSNGGLSFQLSVIDEKGLSCNPLGNGSLIGPGESVRVFLDWSGRGHDVYDTSCLQDLPEVCKSGFAIKRTRQEALSLFSCLEAFLTEEPLGPDDMWYCPTCKEHRQATKKLDLWRLPEILVVHLKRFSYSRYMKNKLDTLVNFPIRNLDLNKYVKSEGAGPQSHVYELYAISNHYGGLGGGHYSAYAKLIDEDRWYHFDDSHVSPVNEDDIRTSAAYVLFYQRVKPKMGAEGSSEVHSPSCCR